MTTPPTEPAFGDGRVLVAFESPSLEWDATPWTALDAYDGVTVAEYTIDRGRQTELDRTDAGNATVQIWDRAGVLDPTNAAGPFYGFLEPLRQIALRRYDPIADEWHTRFRGWIEDYDYSIDPSQMVNRLTLTLTDIFEHISSIELVPGAFGDGVSVNGDCEFDEAAMKVRIDQVLENALIPDDWRVTFSGNVILYGWPYPAGESVMTVIQEAVDAEFSGVGNVYPDRFGRLAIHGRLSRFDVSGVLAGADPGTWPWHSWHVGDGAAVNLAPSTTAHIREFGFSRGLSKIINQAVATPVRDNPLTAVERAGQLVEDTGSIAQYGIRSWSAQNLLTKTGLIGSVDDLTETRRQAEYYVGNYSFPRERATGVGFRSMMPGNAGAGRTWALLCEVDIADEVLLTVASPGGGGFSAEPYFVEGVHESCRPAASVRVSEVDYALDDVTMTLDISPQALYEGNPWS